MLRHTTVLITVAALSACAPTAVEPSPEPSAATEPSGDACGASKVASYLGQLTSSDTIAAIGGTVGHNSIRVINPGDAVTMDFRADRLNVETGDDGRIIRLRCG